MRQGRRRTRRGVVVAGLLAVVMAGGCEMHVDVGVDLDRDGGGRVAVAIELDADAAERLPDLGSQLRLEDLRTAGWAVEGPRVIDDGPTVISATKDFATPEEATLVLRDVSGPGGPFQGLEVARRSSFLRTGYTFTGAVDLGTGVEAFADDELRRRFEGSGFSLGTADLERAIGAPVADTFSFEVRARLPGSITVEGAGTEDGDGVVWHPVVGERLTLAAESETLHRQRLAWLVASAGAALAAAMAFALGRRRRRNHRRTGGSTVS